MERERERWRKKAFKKRQDRDRKEKCDRKGRVRKRGIVKKREQLFIIERHKKYFKKVIRKEKRKITREEADMKKVVVIYKADEKVGITCVYVFFLKKKF